MLHLLNKRNSHFDINYPLAEFIFVQGGIHFFLINIKKQGAFNYFLCRSENNTQNIPVCIISHKRAGSIAK